MTSPWGALPEQPPYVLLDDLPFISEFNRRAKRKVRINTTLMPEPYFGRRNAPIVVLLLNPGIGKKDARHHKKEDFLALLREELACQTPSSHFHLLDQTKGPGFTWWSRACSELIHDAGIDTVANNLLSVEFSAYHSREFAHSHLRLPSQAHAFQLVRNAIRRNAYVVCMRGLRIWTGAIPELGKYDRLISPKNKRCNRLSKGNLKQHYHLLVRELRSAQGQ